MDRWLTDHQVLLLRELIREPYWSFKVIEKWFSAFDKRTCVVTETVLSGFLSGVVFLYAASLFPF